jgi:anaerobic ribonucleoside-triphosphate reductase
MINPYLFIQQEIKTLEKKIKEFQDYKKWKIQQVSEQFDDQIEETTLELEELKKSVLNKAFTGEL